MSRPVFSEIWSRIEGHVGSGHPSGIECPRQGRHFHQKRGQRFCYTIRGAVLNPCTTDWNIPRSQFEKAFDRTPEGGLDGPGQINDLQGPSYIWAILDDQRIRLGNW